MTVSMKATGAIFNAGGTIAHDIIEQESTNMMRDIAKAGVERLQSMFQSRPTGVLLSVQEAGKGRASGARGTHYRDTIHALVSSRNVTIMDNNAVYGPWLEGTSSRNLTTRFKGYASFRKVQQWMETTAAASVVSKYETLLAARLNG